MKMTPSDVLQTFDCCNATVTLAKMPYLLIKNAPFHSSIVLNRKEIAILQTVYRHVLCAEEDFSISNF